MAHNTNGSKWIRPEKRLAIYVRDGLACVYCGKSVEGEEPAVLTLDHILPSSLGGGNEATNLITACLSCNSARGNRTLLVFSKTVAAYRNLDATSIRRRIARLSAKPLDVPAAKALIAARKG